MVSNNINGLLQLINHQTDRSEAHVPQTLHQAPSVIVQFICNTFIGIQVPNS